jgi:peptidoglycan/LPS O-acetylase OafA/YrhL
MTSSVVQEPIEATREEQPTVRFAHQPALDGLRALAVMSVILYHQFGDGWARGGFLGVDVFFVLSGYLITSLLLSEHRRNGRVDFAHFYGRRARRLLPALGIFLLIVAGFAAFVSSPLALGRIRSDSIATIFYVENYWQAGRAFVPQPVGHMWSLAIEEQFYLIWPVTLVGLLLWAKGRSRRLLGGVIGLAAASAILMAFAYHKTNFGYLYLATEMRAHELLIGAALAVLLIRGWSPHSRAGRVALECAGIAGLAAFVLLVHSTTIDSAWLYRGGFALIATGVAVTITAAVQDGSAVVGRVLAVRPLTVVGLMSYGLYLYHEPVNFLITPDRMGGGEYALFAVRLAVMLAIAALSLLLVERPIRTANMSLRTFANYAVPTGVVVIVVIFVATRGAVPINPSTTEVALYHGIAAAAPPAATKVLVVGDGIASSMKVSDGTFKGAGIFGAIDRDWCTFQTTDIVMGHSAVAANPRCPSPTNGLSAAVDGFRPNVSVLMIGTQEVLDRVNHGRDLAVGTPETAAFLARQLERARLVLTSRGGRMMLATVPCMRIPLLGATSTAAQTRRIDWVNDQFRLYARQHSDSVQIVEFGKFLCDGAQRRVVNGQSLGDSTGVFLSPEGARATWEWLASFAA